MTIRAFCFPGQGSQAIGMGKDIAEQFPQAKEVFAEVDDALGQDLSGLMFAGSEEELRLTQNAQPALMAVSMAVVKTLEAHGVTVENDSSFVAGHSLGEYSALCAAGTFSISDAAILLRTRGLSMQQAVPVGQGAMAAILGLEMAQVQELADQAGQGQICDVANDNSPGQVVVSGDVSAIERAVEIAKSMGAKRALMLPVSAPFHCRLMQPAAEAMEEALANVKMNAPSVPLVANVLAQPVSDTAAIRNHLVEQVVGMVRWTETVQWFADAGKVEQIVELGSGKVLAGLVKRIDRGLPATSIGDSAQITAFVEQTKA